MEKFGTINSSEKEIDSMLDGTSGNIDVDSHENASDFYFDLEVLYPDRSRSLEKETVVDDSEPIKEKGSTFQHVFRSKDKLKYSTTLQKWRGVVTKVYEEGFEAELEDLTNKGTKEVAEFYIDDISPDDQKLLSEGAVFYWSIGYKNQSGQVIKESIIRFQRIVDWSEKDFDSAADRAKFLFDRLDFK